MIAYIALIVSLLNSACWITIWFIGRKLFVALKPMLQSMAQMSQISQPVIIDSKTDL